MKKSTYSSAIFLSFILLAGVTTTFAQWVKQNLPNTVNDIIFPIPAGMVYTQNGQNSRILEIDSQNFESGVYLLEYEVNGERRVEKVLVQH